MIEKSQKGRRTPPTKKRSRRNGGEEVASKQREKVNEEEPLGKFTGSPTLFLLHTRTHTLYAQKADVFSKEGGVGWGGGASIFIFRQASQVFIPRP